MTTIILSADMLSELLLESNKADPASVAVTVATLRKFRGETVIITDGKLDGVQMPDTASCTKCGLYARYRVSDFICDSCNALAAADAVIATSDVTPIESKK